MSQAGYGDAAKLAAARELARSFDKAGQKDGGKRSRPLNGEICFSVVFARNANLIQIAQLCLRMPDLQKRSPHPCHLRGHRLRA